LKKELGAWRTQAPRFHKAADDFKVAYAEKSKHEPQAAKRDKSCQAYQVALDRIDPTNPVVAQRAIDQELAAVNDLQAAGHRTSGLKF
jgi:hypothetical protein